MTILFSNFSPKIPKSGMFGPRFQDFYFCTKLCNKTNSKVLISNMRIFSQIPAQKYSNKAILVPNLGIFVFSQNFVIRHDDCRPSHTTHTPQRPSRPTGHSGHFRCVCGACQSTIIITTTVNNFQVCVKVIY